MDTSYTLLEAGAAPDDCELLGQHVRGYRSDTAEPLVHGVVSETMSSTKQPPWHPHSAAERVCMSLCYVLYCGLRSSSSVGNVALQACHQTPSHPCCVIANLSHMLPISHARTRGPSAHRAPSPSGSNSEASRPPTPSPRRPAPGDGVLSPHEDEEDHDASSGEGGSGVDAEGVVHKSLFPGGSRGGGKKRGAKGGRGRGRGRGKKGK